MFGWTHKVLGRKAFATVETHEKFTGRTCFWTDILEKYPVFELLTGLSVAVAIRASHKQIVEIFLL